MLHLHGGPAKWLLVSAALEILASSLLGYVMLVPMQPWAKGLRDKWPPAKALMSVHLDMIMLALMQAVAAFGMAAVPGAHDRLIAALLVSSGWLNVTPYAWRMVGVNAFALTGRSLQRFAALTSFVGTVALTGGWVGLLVGWI
jgi:hypothetical protein